MKNKLPWFPFLASVWLCDARVMSMTLAEQGLYVRLLCVQWLEGGLSEATATALGNGDSGVRLPIVLACFPPHPTIAGLLANPKLLQIASEQSLKHRSHARAGRQGGLSAAKARRQRGQLEVEGSTKTKPSDADASVEAPRKPIVKASPKTTWLAPYFAAYSAVAGVLPPGRLASAVSPVRASEGDAVALAAFERWVASPDVRFGPEWWAAHWRQFTGNGKPETRQDRNEAAIDQGLATWENLREGVVE